MLSCVFNYGIKRDEFTQKKSKTVTNKNLRFWTTSFEQ